jgi:hypothetical protein
MPSAYAESRKDKEKVVRKDIGGLMAELSRRPQTTERTRKPTGPERPAVLKAMGPVGLRDVDEAQALLVNVAKDLAAKGEIIIAVLLSTGVEIGVDGILSPNGARLDQARGTLAAHAVVSAEQITRNLVGRTVAEVERDLILETLKHCLGNRTHAANILGISIRTLRNKLNEYASDGSPIPPPHGGSEQRRCLIDREICHTRLCDGHLQNLPCSTVEGSGTHWSLLRLRS